MSGVGLVLDQVRLEQAALRRNPQAAFFAVLLPVALLLLLGVIDDPDEVVDGQAVARYLAAGTLAFGIVAATYVNLAVSLTAQREEGVLKRLRATPLPFGAFVAGRVASVLLTTLVVSLVFVALGAALYGASPPASQLPAHLVAVVAGTCCFSALGFALAAAVGSAAAATPIANATFFPLALLSGVFGVDSTPEGALDTVSSLLPVRALSDALRHAWFTGASSAGFSPSDLAVLAAWGLGGLLVAVRWFRWTPRR